MARGTSRIATKLKTKTKKNETLWGGPLREDQKNLEKTKKNKKNKKNNISRLFGEGP